MRSQLFMYMMVLATVAINEPPKELPVGMNEYNRSRRDNIPYIMDDARYSSLKILEDGDLLGMELSLYKIQGRIQGVVRYAEGTYVPPEVVDITIDNHNNISFKASRSYGFIGKISQYNIKGVLYDRDGNQERDILLNRQLTPLEPLLIKINSNEMPIEGEYMNYSFDHDGGIHGVRIRLVGYGDDSGFKPYVQFADGSMGEIYMGNAVEYNGKNHVSFNIDASGSKYEKIQGDIYCKYMAATAVTKDGTSSTLTLVRR